MLPWVGLLGCPDPGPPPDDPPKPATSTSELRTDAHLAAYERLLPLAETALALADPLAAAALDRGPPRMRPFAPAERARVREAVDAAWREAEQIDAALLGPERAAILRVVRFGLLRARDELERRPAARTDPGVPIAALADLIDALREREPAPNELAMSFGHAAAALAAGVADLGATSPEALQAARDDLAAVRPRVAAWVGRAAPVAEQADRLLAAIDAAATELASIADALPKAEPAGHDDRLWSHTEDTRIRRLPARLDATTLRRRLDVEEGEARAIEALARDMIDTAHRLASMRPASPPPGTPARPVDARRCLAAWAPLKTFADPQPALAGATIDCVGLGSRLGAAAIDDATLTIAIVHAGIVQPVRTTRRRAEPPALALVEGRSAPRSHVHAQTLAVLAGIDDGAAKAVALREAGDAACRTATALWIHGELGDDATLATRLGTACAHRSIDAWIADATARPRASLDGLGLVLLGRGPADVVALERYWWLPIGLVLPTARPAPAPAPAVTEVAIEPLHPGGTGS